MLTLASPDQELLDALSIADLILQVDTRRSDYDPFKLTPALVEALAPRLAEARALNAVVALGAHLPAEAANRLNQSRTQLGALLLQGFNTLRDTPEEDAPASDITQALETYGWERGLLGSLNSPSRVEILARAAGLMTPQLPPLLRYPLPILKQITNWLGVLDVHKQLATGAKAETILRERDRKRDLLLQSISRVRHHYCAASDAGGSTAELARVGLSIATAEASAGELPDTPGPMAFTNGRLSVSGLPAYANYLVAWRQPAGGTEERAGVSSEPVVGVNDFSPLHPGVEYEMWVTGRNAWGDGPESPRIRITT